MSRSTVLALLFLLIGGRFLRPSPGLLAQAPAPELADAPGKDLVLTLCGDCHEAAPKITKLRKTRPQWADLITDMQTRGLMADDKEIEVMLSYLADNYGPPAASDQSDKNQNDKK